MFQENTKIRCSKFLLPDERGKMMRKQRLSITGLRQASLQIEPLTLKGIRLGVSHVVLKGLAVVDHLMLVTMLIKAILIKYIQPNSPRLFLVDGAMCLKIKGHSVRRLRRLTKTTKHFLLNSAEDLVRLSILPAMLLTLTKCRFDDLFFLQDRRSSHLVGEFDWSFLFIWD